jgi:formate dehydrogenase iron-sulfur subunit
MSKAFFIDLSRCTACRGCQIACKQWNKNGADETVNWGSHQNPPEVNANTFKLVRFEEIEPDGKLQWVFFPEQCRHCIVPPCKMIGDTVDETAIIQDEATGAVLFTERTKNLNYEDVRAACPYDIPRQDPKTKVLRKCTMCFDRVSNGLKPACVQSCPTGAMNFGERDDMLKMARERLALIKKTRPQAVIGDESDLNCLVLYEFDPKLYYKHAVASVDTPLLSRKAMFAKVLRPVRSLVG